MPKGYHHLAYERRCQLDALKKRGDSVSEIAAALQVHRSTVYRELHRNGKGGRYSYKQAHRQAVARRRSASSGAKKLTKRLLEWVKSMLYLYWSPEQISGWLKRKMSVQPISHESIYQHIWRDKRRGGGLYHYLRHQGKKYQKRGSGKAGRGYIPGRVGIEERPNIVAEKKRLGDWEIDTIIGKGKKGAIVSMVERRTKLTKLARVSRKTATEVGCALKAVGRKILRINAHRRQWKRFCLIVA